MPYMLLIHEPVGQRVQRSEAEGHAVYQHMLEFAGSLKQRGVLRGVESLTSQDDSSRVKVRDGKVHVLDGPFAEAKEMVGGFFLVDVPTREAAVALARELPLVDRLLEDKSMRNYHWLPSVRGDLLARLGRKDEARREFERAASLAGNARERELLTARAAGLATRH